MHYMGLFQSCRACWESFSLLNPIIGMSLRVAHALQSFIGTQKEQHTLIKAISVIAVNTFIIWTSLNRVSSVLSFCFSFWSHIDGCISYLIIKMLWNLFESVLYKIAYSSWIAPPVSHVFPFKSEMVSVRLYEISWMHISSVCDAKNYHPRLHLTLEVDTVNLYLQIRPL